MRIFIKSICLLILVAIISASYFFTETETGLRVGIQYLSTFFPGNLQIHQVKGTLFSDFALQNITYQDPHQTATIQSLQVSWNPINLLHGKVVINKITLNQAKINIKKPDSSEQFNYAWLHKVTIRQFVVNQLEIHNADAEIYFNGTLSTTWDAAWKIHIPHLATFMTDCSGSFYSEGTIRGGQFKPFIHASLHAKDVTMKKQKISQIDGKANLHLQLDKHSDFSITATDIKIQDYILPKMTANATLQVSRKHSAIIAKLDVVAAQKHHISALFTLPDYTHLFDFSQPLTGKITLNSSQLDFLTGSLSDVTSTKGIVSGTLSLNGTIAKPLMSGELHLHNGHIAIPKLGIHLDKIELHSENITNQQIHYTGKFESGNGKANLQGMIDLSQADFPITLELQGNDLSVVNLPEYKILASPQVKVHFIKDQLNMDGEIFIPYADITPKSFNSTATLSSDIVFVEEHKKIPTLPFSTSMRINLTLGNKIHVTFKELQTNLRGKLQISQTSNSLATATGELHAVDGTYRAYGKTLAIQEGRLVFTDSQLTNPGLNIRATKTVKTVSVSGTSRFENNTGLTPISMGTETITIGVQIIGSFEKPIVSLFSNPAGLKQTDILSYLILGHPQTQTSGKQTGALLSAVSALNAGSTSKLGNITKEIQNKLGLNELNVETTEVFNPNSGSSSQATSLVVGKELAPNFYVHYCMGLFDPIKILNLRYQISKRFAIQSETSNMGNGADLLYGIERD